MEQVERVCKLDPATAVPFVGQTLEYLKKEIAGESALLGFCGAPYTLASYIVEGGSSKNYTNIKQIVEGVKQRKPDLPIILYISGGAGILERMADTGVDIVSLDTSLLKPPARGREYLHTGIQGNLDPCLLLA